MKHTPLPMLLILALTLSAAAWDGVEVTSSSGALRQEIYGDPSPTPGYCYWDSDPAAGPTFHATNTDGYGNMDCPHPWLVHCDGDSLAYRGSWPLLDYLYVRSSAYRVDLSCTVDISVTTRLSASRAVTGNLDVDVHTLTVTFPDGGEVVFLAPGSGPDQIQLDVGPGTYQVALTVEALQDRYLQKALDPYEGSVTLKWEDPAGVATEATSWSAVKAMFR